MKLILALSLAAVALAASAASAAAAPVVHGDWRLGGYRVKADGTLGGARAEFGSPSRVRRTSDASCSVAWRRLGLRMAFYNLGGLDPCGRRTGHFSHAVASGERWRTNRDLGIGDSARRLHRLYPDARWRPDGAGRRGWWLVTRRSPFGDGSRYPGLLATMRDGRVHAFVVRYPAGGD